MPRKDGPDLGRKTRSLLTPSALQATPEGAGAEPVPAPALGFPIVGVGASAGGLGAFEAFFSGMPAHLEPGMAFVLVQHLDPDHKSLLTELVQRYTRLQVFEVEDGMAVQVNCAYIIPPNRDLVFIGGSLHLLEPVAPRGQRMPIDSFFRSLALDQHERAIGIVLSGTGSDGTLGLRAIKGEGGMAMAQTPTTSDYDGMPRSALATGLVDFELAPAAMPAQLMAYVAHAFGRRPLGPPVPSPRSERGMNKLFVLLRAQTGHDFSQYKPSTIHRRLDRRMAVQQITDLDDYLSLAQRNPAELETLFRDLLIGVTNFFRDPEAFQVLETRVLPELLAAKPQGSPIRVWVAGCSTGEEAYSVAILLQEAMDRLHQNHPVQVFATDLDAQAIATARTGAYPASISMDLTPERLARCFTLDPAGRTCRVRKSIRDLLIFSEQDLLKDPPFSRLDLISCRNLMIYLAGPVQKRLIPLFHYALRPQGFLFLGSSESVGEATDLFTVLDRKHMLYQRKADADTPLGRLSPVMTALETLAPRNGARPGFPLKVPFRALAEEAILRQATPPGILVNAQGDILYFHGHTGLFLEPAPGEAGAPNVLRMARDGLRQPLALALREASGARERVDRPGLRVDTNGLITCFDLSIHPLPQPRDPGVQAPLYLVMLEAAQSALRATPPEAPALRPGPHAESSAELEALRLDLETKEAYLKTANEELETSVEELKSANEEMQSTNEEVQSTNEELETSKEELQSVNEELATVNAELQTKVADLSRANDDMNNLLAGTGIATIFVDRELRLMRFTPAATGLLNLIPTDLGRPIGHITPNLLDYTALVADTRAVLDTLAPREMEVQTPDAHWFRLAIQPYRTLENVVEGAVLTFQDITLMKAAREALGRAAQVQRLAVVVRDSADAVTTQDLEGRTTAWNPGAVRLYGWTEAEALGMNVTQRIPERLRKEAGRKAVELSQASQLAPYVTQVLTKDGQVLDISMTATALVDQAGHVYAIATTERARSAMPR